MHPIQEDPVDTPGSYHPTPPGPARPTPPAVAARCDELVHGYPGGSLRELMDLLEERVHAAMTTITATEGRPTVHS